MKIELITKNKVNKMIDKKLKEIWKEMNKINEKLGEVKRLAMEVRFE